MLRKLLRWLLRQPIIITGPLWICDNNAFTFNGMLVNYPSKVKQKNYKSSKIDVVAKLTKPVKKRFDNDYMKAKLSIDNGRFYMEWVNGMTTKTDDLSMFKFAPKRISIRVLNVERRIFFTPNIGEMLYLTLDRLDLKADDVLYHKHVKTFQILDDRTIMHGIGKIYRVVALRSHTPLTIGTMLTLWKY